MKSCCGCLCSHSLVVRIAEVDRLVASSCGLGGSLRIASATHISSGLSLLNWGVTRENVVANGRDRVVPESPAMQLDFWQQGTQAFVVALLSAKIFSCLLHKGPTRVGLACDPKMSMTRPLGIFHDAKVCVHTASRMRRLFSARCERATPIVEDCQAALNAENVCQQRCSLVN